VNEFCDIQPELELLNRLAASPALPSKPSQIEFAVVDACYFEGKNVNELQRWKRFMQECCGVFDCVTVKPVRGDNSDWHSTEFVQIASLVQAVFHLASSSPATAAADSKQDAKQVSASAPEDLTAAVPRLSGFMRKLAEFLDSRYCLVIFLCVF
jgi:hypothetical protein